MRDRTRRVTLERRLEAAATRVASSLDVFEKAAVGLEAAAAEYAVVREEAQRGIARLRVLEAQADAAGADAQQRANKIREFVK